MSIPIRFSSNLPAAAQMDGQIKTTLDAARQFEALLIGQLMKSIREEGSGWLGSGGDAAGEQAMGLAEQEFAKALAAQGGLGLAPQIASQLAARTSATPSASQIKGASPAIK